MGGGLWAVGFWGSRYWGLGYWSETAVVPATIVEPGKAGPYPARHRGLAVYPGERFRPRTSAAVLPRLTVSATVRFGTTERPARRSPLDWDRLLGERPYAPLTVRSKPAPKAKPPGVRYRATATAGVLPVFLASATVSAGRVASSLVSLPWMEFSATTKHGDPWAAQRALEDEMLIRFGTIL